MEVRHVTLLCAPPSSYRHQPPVSVCPAPRSLPSPRAVLYQKRVCQTCGIPRSKSSFACHYDSHAEICHGESHAVALGHTLDRNDSHTLPSLFVQPAKTSASTV